MKSLYGVWAEINFLRIRFPFYGVLLGSVVLIANISLFLEYACWHIHFWQNIRNEINKKGAKSIPTDRIQKYGFAFRGKEVLCWLDEDHPSRTGGGQACVPRERAAKR